MPFAKRFKKPFADFTDEDIIKYRGPFLKNWLRNASYRWYAASLAWKAAKGNQPGHYNCKVCLALRPKKEMQADHITPVVPVTGWDSWDGYLTRMFCPPEGFQILCRDTCHKNKTKAENQQRYFNKTGCYSPAALKEMSESQKGNTRLRGIPKTEAHKRAMSIERKGKPQTPARIAAAKTSGLLRQRQVEALKLSDGSRQVYASVTEAAEALGIQMPNITRVCNQKQGRTQAGGYKFAYLDKKAVK